jgi:large subunit ribosomal protein L29
VRVSKFPILRKREIKQLLPEERRKKVAELRAELTTVRTAVKSGGTVENPARIRELRRTIAKLLTMENTIPSTGE